MHFPRPNQLCMIDIIHIKMELKLLNTPTQNLLKATVKYPSVDNIVYELLKNSLAALADYIEIIFKTTEICIRDNGSGIPYDILSAIVSRKIEGGLSHMQMISSLTIITKFENACWKTKSTSILPSKCLIKPGTVITISSLYHKLPARIATVTSELIYSIITKLEPLIIINPSLQIKFLNESSIISRYPSVRSLKDRIMQTAGVNLLHGISYIGESIEVRGYISDVNDCLQHFNYQYMFINMNPALISDISNRINSLYFDAIKLLYPDARLCNNEGKVKRYPVFVLLFADNNGMGNMFSVIKEITVMIKEQVFKGVITEDVCDKYLTQISVKREKSGWVSPKTYSFVADIDDKTVVNILDNIDENSKTQKKLENTNRKPAFKYTNFSSPEVKSSIAGLLPKGLDKYSDLEISSEINPIKMLCSGLKVTINSLNIEQIIAQVNDKFIVGTILVNNIQILAAFDQHAVNERVHLENLISTLSSSLSHENCKILLKLSAFDHSELLKNKEHLEKYNFLVKEESEKLFLVKLPKLYNFSFTLTDFFAAIHCSTSIPPPILNALKYKACRSSVKFGDSLSLDQCRTLCTSLQTCVIFDKCAHGRPTFYPLMAIPFPKPLARPRFLIVKYKCNKKSPLYI